MDDKIPEEQEELNEQQLRERRLKIIEKTLESARRNHEEEAQFEAVVRHVNRVSGQAYREMHGLPSIPDSYDGNEEDDDESEHEIGEDEVHYDPEKHKRAE